MMHMWILVLYLSLSFFPCAPGEETQHVNRRPQHLEDSHPCIIACTFPYEHCKSISSTTHTVNNIIMHGQDPHEATAFCNAGAESGW